MRHKEQGNNFYKEKNYQRAIEAYTDAIVKQMLYPPNHNNYLENKPNEPNLLSKPCQSVQNDPWVQPAV